MHTGIERPEQRIAGDDGLGGGDDAVGRVQPHPAGRAFQPRHRAVFMQVRAGRRRSTGEAQRVVERVEMAAAGIEQRAVAGAGHGRLCRRRIQNRQAVIAEPRRRLGLAGEIIEVSRTNGGEQMSGERQIAINAVPRHQIDHQIAGRKGEVEQRAAPLRTEARHQIGSAQPQARNDLTTVAT